MDYRGRSVCLLYVKRGEKEETLITLCCAVCCVLRVLLNTNVAFPLSLLPLPLLLPVFCFLFVGHSPRRDNHTSGDGNGFLPIRHGARPEYLERPFSVPP